MKNYNNDHRDTILPQKREYRRRNQPLLSQKLICDVCGKQCTKGSLSRHKKSLRHLTALAKLNCASYSDPRYEEQEVIQLLSAHMEACSLCEIKFRKDSLSRHKKTTRHLAALAKLNSGSESGPQYAQQLSEVLNSRKMTCEVCGLPYTKGSFGMHKKTKRHLTVLAKLNLTANFSSDP